jgi:hypothetical protein
MTDAHYKHIQKLIKRELGGRFESSIWFALMLAAVGIAATIGVTVLGTDIHNATHKGMLEEAGWFFLAIGLLCAAFHFFGSRNTGEQRANDLIEMMDTYNIEVQSRASVAPTTVANLSEAAASAGANSPLRRGR